MIAGRYALEREIGRGGMGAVWLARDEVLGREVALKRIGFGVGGTSPDLERAEREARLAARLNHPHVVAVYDLVTEGDERWLVMEHVAGATLAELVRRDGPLTPDQVAPLLGQAADALAAAHGAGITHRDVKPSNILVTPQGQVKLSDFGIARAQADTALTQTGLVTGSPAYLAPEVATGQQASAASDVWSLGATLFHALSGHPPYEVGDNVLGTMYRIVHEDPPRLGDAAGWLAPVLEATMTADIEARWSMAQVRDFLAHGRRAGAPVAAAPTRPAPIAPPPQREDTRLLSVPAPPVDPVDPVDPAPPARPRRRSGLLPVLAVVVVVVAVVLIAWLLGSRGGNNPAPTSDRSRTPSTSAGTGTGSPSSSAPPSSSTPPSPTGMTADGMESFIRDYLATVTSDPKAAWEQLTPGFQRQSGNYGQYQGFWRTIESADVVSAQADPASRTITYRVDYLRKDGSRTTDNVTLQLQGNDQDLKIAGES